MPHLKKLVWLLALATLNVGAQSRQLNVQQQCEADVETWTKSFEASLTSSSSKLGAVRTTYFQGQRQRLINLYSQYKAEDPANRDCLPLAEQAKSLNADLQSALAALNAPPVTVDPVQSKKEIDRCDVLLAGWSQRFTPTLQQEKASKRIGKITLMQLEAQQERIPALYATLKADGLTSQECDQVANQAHAALTSLNNAIAAVTTPRPKEKEDNKGDKDALEKQRLACINEVERWAQAFTEGLEKAKAAGKVKNVVQKGRYSSAVKGVKSELARYEANGTTAKQCPALIKSMQAWDKELNGL